MDEKETLQISNLIEAIDSENPGFQYNPIETLNGSKKMNGVEIVTEIRDVVFYCWKNNRYSNMKLKTGSITSIVELKTTDFTTGFYQNSEISSTIKQIMSIIENPIGLFAMKSIFSYMVLDQDFEKATRRMKTEFTMTVLDYEDEVFEFDFGKKEISLFRCNDCDEFFPYEIILFLTGESSFVKNQYDIPLSQDNLNDLAIGNINRFKYTR